MHENYRSLLEPIDAFLQVETPQAWLDFASKPENLNTLLIDHCNCELKAAQTAIWLMRKYAVNDESGKVLLSWVKPYEEFVYYKSQNSNFPDKKLVTSVELNLVPKNPYGQDIVDKMVRLVKEELLHFEQVLTIIKTRGIAYTELSAARYAKGLIKSVRTFEPATLVDKLIIGAYIEARSCERFAKLAPYLDEELKTFYLRLLKSEARHFRDYLTLAEQIAGESISERVNEIGRLEAELIASNDDLFRFHSGTPSASCAV